MKVLNVNRTKLATAETVRYHGPDSRGEHGVYSIQLFVGSMDESADSNSVRMVDIHLSLEALMQLRQRIDAALQHMITH